MLAGYSNHGPFFGNLVNGSFPSLERATGFTLSLQWRLNREDHSGDRNGDGLIDRGGISLTLISSDRLGIEVVFWSDEIWVQSDGMSTPLFTHSPGEWVLRNTTGWTNDQLRVQGDDYSLLAADESSGESLLLKSRHKDYGPFDHPQPPASAAAMPASVPRSLSHIAPRPGSGD